MFNRLWRSFEFRVYFFIFLFLLFWFSSEQKTTNRRQRQSFRLNSAAQPNHILKQPVGMTLFFGVDAFWFRTDDFESNLFFFSYCWILLAFGVLRHVPISSLFLSVCVFFLSLSLFSFLICDTLNDKNNMLRSLKTDDQDRREKWCVYRSAIFIRTHYSYSFPHIT